MMILIIIIDDDIHQHRQASMMIPISNTSIGGGLCQPEMSDIISAGGGLCQPAAEMMSLIIIIPGSTSCRDDVTNHYHSWINQLQR